MYIYIYIYKGEAHIQLHVQLICTVSTKHTDVLIWSSWGVKDHATSSLFSLFFQHKICNFFFKNVFKVSEMLRLHSYILWSLLKFFHIKSQHYILCMIYIYKGGGTHTVVCTAHLYSAKHTVVFIWSSWVVKNHATSFLFLLFFQHKIYNFFFKNVFNKKCQKCWDCIPIYYEAC